MIEKLLYNKCKITAKSLEKIKIHCALKGYDGLPKGIGADFFKFMTPQTALASYKSSLYIAKQEGNSNTLA